MPKYLMVFDSAKVIPDDEFEAIVQPAVKANGFKFCYAMNCQGIREELYTLQDRFLDQVTTRLTASIKHEISGIVETEVANNVVDDISSLFKI